MLKTILLLLTGLSIAIVICAQQKESASMDIKQILQERIDTAHKSVGIVVGTLDEKGVRIITQGKADRENTRQLDGDTVFEIGSVSKVFTSLILADMVQRGEVKLDDPISKYLPKSVKVPARKGKEITLVDLATHTSGLPRLPENFTPANQANPYVDYTVEQMYEFLSSFTLKRDIGAKYEYSNLGAGLLGHILALKAGTNYEALVKERICRPLGMTNTTITLSPEQKARLAKGHNEHGRPVANWDLPTLAGAGAIRSTVNDLLKLVAANMGATKSDLTPAMELEQTPRHAAGSAVMQIGLAWHISQKYEPEVVWHNGGTGGYHSFIGFDKKNQRGIVVLANSANSIDDIGFYWLNEKYKLSHPKATNERVVISVKQNILEQYVGRYQMAPKIFMDVRREEDHLQVKLTGQSYLDTFPETETDFFLEAVDAQITFNKDAKDNVTSLVLHQNGLDQTAKKISNEAPKEPVVIKLDPKIYDSYVGEYKLAASANFTVKRVGDKLMVMLTGQPFFEVFPTSETEFFYKVVDAQLTFVKNAKGEVTDVILHQNGLDQKSKKIK